VRSAGAELSRRPHGRPPARRAGLAGELLVPGRQRQHEPWCADPRLHQGSARGHAGPWRVHLGTVRGAMFERFLQAFRPIPGEQRPPDPRGPWPHGGVRGFRALMTEFAGRGFNDGVYRLHSESSGRMADEFIVSQISRLKDRAYSFGYTWNGMQLTL